MTVTSPTIHSYYGWGLDVRGGIQTNADGGMGRMCQNANRTKRKGPTEVRSKKEVAMQYTIPGLGQPFAPCPR